MSCFVEVLETCGLDLKDGIVADALENKVVCEGHLHSLIKFSD